MESWETIFERETHRKYRLLLVSYFEHCRSVLRLLNTYDVTSQNLLFWSNIIRNYKSVWFTSKVYRTFIAPVVLKTQTNVHTANDSPPGGSIGGQFSGKRPLRANKADCLLFGENKF